LGPRSAAVWPGWHPLREPACAGRIHGGSHADVAEWHVGPRDGRASLDTGTRECADGPAGHHADAQCDARTQCGSAGSGAAGAQRNASGGFADDAAGELQPRERVAGWTPGWRCNGRTNWICAFDAVADYSAWIGERIRSGAVPSCARCATARGQQYTAAGDGQFANAARCREQQHDDCPERSSSTAERQPALTWTGDE